MAVKIIEKKQEEIPCCAYVRVSTKKDEQEHSMLLQESYWIEKLKNLPNRKFCGIYVDQGISGYKVIQRKEYCKMIEFALAGFIKEIYTKSIYRFGRNTYEALETIQKLREAGVAVIFETEEINTLTCSSDLLLKLKSIFAEQELKNMSKNVLFNVRNRFQKGIVPIFHVYGYDLDENKKFQINHDQAKVVQLIFTLYLKGYGYDGISKELNKLRINSPKGAMWRGATVQKILTNPIYIGNVLLQKSITVNGKAKPNNGEATKYLVENNHEPIIDKETFDCVQQEILKRSKGKANHSRTYSLSKKIICGNCGKVYSHVINSRIVNFDNELWVCSLKNRFNKSYCLSNNISDTLIKEIIVDAYNDYIDLPYEIKTEDELQTRNRDISMVLETLKRYYLDKLITYEQYQTETQKLKNEQYDIVKKLRDNKIMSLYKKPTKKVSAFSDEIVLNHIDHIEIDGYKVKIIFKNSQEVVKEFKYEHRKYCKNY